MLEVEINLTDCKIHGESNLWIALSNTEGLYSLSRANALILLWYFDITYHERQ